MAIRMDICYEIEDKLTWALHNDKKQVPKRAGFNGKSRLFSTSILQECQAVLWRYLLLDGFKGLKDTSAVSLYCVPAIAFPAAPIP